MTPGGNDGRDVAEADEDSGEEGGSLSPTSLPRLGASLCDEPCSFDAPSLLLWAVVSAVVDDKGRVPADVGEGLAPGLRGRKGGRKEPILAAMKAPEKGEPPSPPA